MKTLRNILEQQGPDFTDAKVVVPNDISGTNTGEGINLGDIFSGGNDDGDSGAGLATILGKIGSGGKTAWEFNRTPTGQMKMDYEDAKNDADSYTKGNIFVHKKDDGTEEIVLAGKTVNKIPHLFKVAKNDQGKWGWLNDEHEPPMWEDFKDY